MELRCWSDGDLDVLRAINTPSMKRHVGGPETEEQLVRLTEPVMTIRGIIT